MDAIFEKLGGKKEGCEVRWHVTIRSLDDFPAVVALHRGPHNASCANAPRCLLPPCTVPGRRFWVGHHAVTHTVADIVCVTMTVRTPTTLVCVLCVCVCGVGWLACVCFVYGVWCWLVGVCVWCRCGASPSVCGITSHGTSDCSPRPVPTPPRTVQRLAKYCTRVSRRVY